MPCINGFMAEVRWRVTVSIVTMRGQATLLGILVHYSLLDEAYSQTCHQHHHHLTASQHSHLIFFSLFLFSNFPKVSSKVCIHTTKECQQPMDKTPGEHRNNTCLYCLYDPSTSIM
jgi:hypothetical protein